MLPSQAQTTPLPLSLAAGLVLGDTYRLEKRLGKGGMGEVWLAAHLLLNEPRAIKFMLGDFATNAAWRERFIQGEARNALRLIHPHIVRVYELGQFQTIPYIVMEYISGHPDGADLKTRLTVAGKLTLAEVGQWLDQIAQALAVAHGMNLVHRDLKPANILLTAQNLAKLSDFGIVKDLEAANDLTGGSYGLGTPLYMSPEQAHGEASASSDQYALGVMLYEMLTGKLPFNGKRDALLIQHATVSPTPPHELDPAIPPAISAIILKALAKQPAGRYPSVLDLAQAYQEALQDRPSSFEAEAPTIPIPVTPTPDTRPLIPDTPHNLPEQTKVLLGRAQELAEVMNLLLEPKIRLVTLTGVGGTGKTSLSLAVAQAVVSGQWSVDRMSMDRAISYKGAALWDAALSVDFPPPSFSDGVYFVALENVTERDTLISSLTQTLGVKEAAGQALVDSLKAYLADKQMLLVLDNFEQLVTQGTTLLSELLKAAPQLKMLVSSRELLRISQEKEYVVEPLALPETGKVAVTPESLAEYTAIALFVERAQAVKPDFALTNQNAPIVADICRKLDGLPLAIELAAARTKLLSPVKLLERLDSRLKLLTGGARDLAARQQTLRGAIDWSYDLLDESEKQLFTRLSIFAGGCTLEAAEAVCNASGDLAVDVLDGLEALVSKSLLKQKEDVSGEMRFTILPTIREYGLEKLQEQGELELMEQFYVIYFVKWTEELEQKIEGENQLVALKELESEYDNVREVLFRAIAKPLPKLALELCMALYRFWDIRSNFSEGRNYLEKVLALVTSEEDKLYRAKALSRLGTFASTLGDYKVAKIYALESLSLGQEINDKLQIAHAREILARVARIQEDYALAQSYLEKNLAYGREIADKRSIANPLFYLGIIATEQQDYTKAQSYLEESLVMIQELGDKHNMGWTLNNLGHVAVNQAEYAKAHHYYKESLYFKREVGDERGIIFSLVSFIFLINHQSNRDKETTKEIQATYLKWIACLSGATARWLANLKLGLFQPERGYYEQALATARTQLDEENFNISFAKGQAMSLDEAIEYALAIKLEE